MAKRIYKFAGSVVCLSAALACLSFAYAQVNQERQEMTSTSNVNGLSQALASLKSQTSLPVVFPAKMPKLANNKPLYAYLEPATQSYNNAYTIDIDYTQACHGAKYCNLGNFMVQKGGSPSMQTDMNNNQITTQVNLLHKQTAYFTPGHSMGDYFPPVIQWVSQGNLYTITWNGPAMKNAQVVMMEMADSVKSA
ncbi:MAG: hypothetical protein K0Q57_1158 [Gammaproteobacteria bacterium]|nr:hypothetical protein [Gammaproteobacteria bacterium]